MKKEVVKRTLHLKARERKWSIINIPLRSTAEGWSSAVTAGSQWLMSKNSQSEDIGAGVFMYEKKQVGRMRFLLGIRDVMEKECR